ncbi:MAG TPA: nuclear transport factor 2 family protein [Candidatus Aquilonibacter sp.]|jgi:ketosteroid isomerase-like protein|nr:nuclear transport factor 2 family protein [Candidatus Aquilonibacter sp.]
MKSIKIALYFFPLLFAGRVPAQANTSAQAAESTVLMLENAWNQALRLGESKALQELFVDGLVYIDYDGKIMNKGQYLAHVQTPLLHPEFVVSESMRAHAYGDSVVVTGVYREKGTKNGQPYALRERFVDTWIQQKGTWLCVSSQSTLISH